MDGFSEFWAKYPRRVAKADARKAWAKLAPDAELLATILKALEWQTQQEQWTRDGGQYTPHAATYLRGERWTDEPPNLAETNPASLAWAEFRKANASGTKPAAWTYPQTEAALQAIGGWGWARGAASRDLDFKQRLFEAAFREGPRLTMVRRA